MSYDRSYGEISTTYRPNSPNGDLVGPTGSMTFVAPGSTTRRQFGLYRRDMHPHAGGPDAHFHRTFSESFYVLEGTIRFFDGRSWLDATAGDFLYVPKGGIHAFKGDSDKPSSLLILFAPGSAREQFFMELDQIQKSGRKLTAREWTELYARHDQFMV